MTDFDLSKLEATPIFINDLDFTYTDDDFKSDLVKEIESLKSKLFNLSLMVLSSPESAKNYAPNILRELAGYETD